MEKKHTLRREEEKNPDKREKYAHVAWITVGKQQRKRKIFCS